ncbi:M20 aminoacylase family protein [Roseateles toxinivorans]|uniref:Hippurate hydrolase n=1 Tax=Roseateles toxinivorans TaxID=270368 RepID=A0A4R6QJF6_9BURK|nr:M20 aminoacylase family protein [Roseateles toxinivorans]TDP63524.1 hippurate hydrolase [Roseateles toxinivorans]
MDSSAVLQAPEQGHPVYRFMHGEQGVLSALRREIHSWPELGFEESRTSDRISAELALLGIDHHRNIGKTGIVGVIHGERTDSGRSVGLRADMDALALTEINSFDHVSRNPGVMHACGHDGHTAMLMGAARYLSRHRGAFNGTVYLIFQPAEEGRGGAQAMLDDGLFERFPAQQIYALHNAPTLPVGTISVAPGACMSSADMFTMRISGRGGHGAHPHLAADPVVAAAHVVTALQSIVARSVPPLETAVLSVCSIRGGDFNARNVIPDFVEIGGTVRTFSSSVQDLMERRLLEVATSVAQAHGASVSMDYERLFPPTVSTEREAAFAAQVAMRLVGAERVITKPMPSTGSEDFSFMLLRRPGAYLRVGQGGAEAGRMLHNPHYDFNDQILPLGASLLAGLALDAMPV